MRAPPDADLAVARRNGERDQAGRHHRAGAKDQVALRHIEAGRPDELAVRGSSEIVMRAPSSSLSALTSSCNTIVSAPCGTTAPVKIRTAVPGLEAAVPRPCPRPISPMRLQGCADSRTVAAANGVAVHRRHRRRRQAQPCRHVACQNASHRVGQRQALARHRGQPE